MDGFGVRCRLVPCAVVLSLCEPVGPVLEIRLGQIPVLPDHDDIFTVAIGGGGREIEASGLDGFVVDHQNLVVMDLVSRDRPHATAGIHERRQSRSRLSAPVFTGIALGVNDKRHIHAAFARRQQRLRDRHGRKRVGHQANLGPRRVDDAKDQALGTFIR